MPRPKPRLSVDSHIPEHPWYEGGSCLLPQNGLAGWKLTDLFYSEDEEHVAAAKQICNKCPIRAKCLETALAFRESEGVWGGMTPNERRSLVRRRRRHQGAA